MANKKITELTTLTSVASGDLVPIVDVSDTTQSSAGTTKKITQTNFIGSIFASPTFTGTTTIATGNVTTLNVSGTTTLNTSLTGVLRANSGVVTTDSDVTDIVSAASLTLAGKVELATTAEINTGTDSTRAIPVDQFVASNRNIRYILYRIIDNTTNIATATTKGGDFELPFTGTITEIGAFVDTAGTTGTMTIDVNLNGTTIMSATKITIDTAEKSSRTAATAPVLTTTAVTAGDLLTFDIDAIHTTPAQGLTIRIGIRMT